MCPPKGSTGKKLYYLYYTILFIGHQELLKFLEHDTLSGNVQINLLGHFKAGVHLLGHRPTPL